MLRSILQIYVKGSDEAFELYKKAFDAQTGYQDIDENGVVIHRELNVSGQAIAVGEADDGTRAGGPNRVTGIRCSFAFNLGKVKKIR